MNKNPNKKTISQDELLDLLKTKEQSKMDALDEFELEAYEGLSELKDDKRILSLNSKIDELLAAESKEAVIVPLSDKQNYNRKLIYYSLGMAASVALIIGLFVIINPAKQSETVADNKSINAELKEEVIIGGTVPDTQKLSLVLEQKVVSDETPPPPVSESNNLNSYKQPIVEEQALNDKSKGYLNKEVLESSADKDKAIMLASEKTVVNDFETVTLKKEEPLKKSQEEVVVTEDRKALDEVKADTKYVMPKEAEKKEEAAKLKKLENKNKVSDKVEGKTRAKKNSVTEDDQKVALGEVYRDDVAATKMQENKTKVVTDSVVTFASNGAVSKPVPVDVVNTGPTSATTTGAISINSLAEFDGGSAKLKEYIKKNLVKSSTSVLGKASVQVKVDDKGKVSFDKIIKNISNCNTCESDIKTLISKMPLWKPAIISGKKAASVVIFEVEF